MKVYTFIKNPNTTDGEWKYTEGKQTKILLFPFEISNLWHPLYPSLETLEDEKGWSIIDKTTNN